MSKRTKIGLGALCLALVIVLAGLYGNATLSAAGYRSTLEYSYRRALDDVTENTRKLQTALSKAVYANTPTMQNSLAATLLENAESAKTALCTLPFSDNKMEQINRFYSRCGDYAQAIAKKVSAGQTVSDEELENLVTMGDYAQTLLDAYDRVNADIRESKITIGETQRLLDNISDFSSLPRFDDSLAQTAQDFADYPALNYDGPFSDHVDTLTPSFLEGLDEIDQTTAQKAAAAFLGLDSNDLTLSGTTDNTLFTYNFTAGETQINITRQGGLIAAYEHADEPTDRTLLEQEAEEYAKEFLKNCGIENVAATYYAESGNTSTISFAAVIQADYEPLMVQCYPDLIQVTVSLQDGSILAMDASGYYLNHRQRQILQPTFSAADANAKISARLRVQGVKLCIIPSGGKYDVLCYEFACKGTQDEDVLVYINANTGLEEALYLVTDTGYSTFAR